MCIKIIKEPYELEMSESFENCIFCNIETNTWHEESNRPVCVKCAQLYSPSEIPKVYFNY